MRFGRALSLAALAAVLPACDGGNNDDEQGRFILFADGFTEPILRPVWLQSGAGNVLLDSVQGTPRPSLSLGPPLGPTGATLRLTADQLFPARASLTISVDLLLNFFPPPLGTGTAGITVFDPDFPSVQASALYDAETFTIQFSIGIIEGPRVVDAGGFHVIAFIVDPAGTASWVMDGVLQQVVSSFPAINLTLRLRNDSDSIFNFDSVLVTSP